MDNPETKATLGYDIVQRQANKNKNKKNGQRKDEHGHNSKIGINSGAGKCWT